MKTKKTALTIYKPSSDSGLPIPAYLSAIQAGFPSPADDYVEKQLDLNELLIKNHPATFFVTVEGESMRDAGIQSGDVLVVDRSISPASGKIVVAIINGEFTVKRINISGQKVTLVAENSAFPDILVTPDADFQVWGVVTYVIHKAS